MAKVQKTVITALGEQMLFSSALTYTNATLCSQDISNLTIDQLRSLTDLTGKVLSSPISAHKRQGNTKADQVDVQVTFTNQDQKADINYSSIGWFARDRQGHETLIAVTPFVGTDTIAAAPPDGAATSSKNITLSMAAGTATEINVLIDPAGSVTPSTFNAEVDKINEALALKADNAELADYAKTADVQAGLDTKADKSTVDSDVKSINDTLATKADKQTVTDDLATKADKATVESELSTKANQSDLDKTNAEVAKKASTTDVNSQLATKADAKDVTDALALKDDTVDVDKKISNVTNSVNSLSSTVTSNKSATDTALDTKADKTTVNQELATKANSTDLDATNKTVATKANSSDVYTKKQVDDAFSSRDATIATKADKATVDAEISKIDFTPYAKTADVNKEIKTVTDLANSKVSADYSYSKAELDKKLLAISTDTSGKVNASQVASMIAGKADKTDVDQKIATVNKSVSDLSDTVSANKTATDASLATKANASDVADNVKTLQANIDTKADKTALDDYAKSADVASDVKTLTDSIATKADAKTVNDAISKIDFTPYAKSADVDSKLKGYTDTADLTKLLAGKADSDFSYSKAELDKKLLDLTTTTGGKVDANQVATMIENKADKSDVTKQIGTVTDLVNIKANSTDVDAALDKKDDITDVDAKIKTVTDLANQVSQKADDNFNKRPVINGVAGDDLFAYKSNQLRLYPGNGQNCKNLPPASNNQWYTVEYIFETPNNDGVAIYRSPLPEIWVVGNNGGTFGTWHKLANDDDFNNLKNQINTKANAGDVSALQNKVNVNTPLFRVISADSTWEDIFGVTNPNNVLTSLRINPGGSGQLVNDFAAGIGFGGDDTKAVISVDYGSHVARFTAGNRTSPGWSEDVAWKSDISSLTQALTKLQAAFDAQQTKIAALQATVNNQANQLTYFKQHYIEGKAFDADQIKQAMAWTGDDGQKLAIIRDKENEGGK